MTDLFAQADQPQLKYTPPPIKRPRQSPETVVVQPDDPTIRYVPLTHGYFAVVDAFLYDWLMQWNWLARKRVKTGKVYAERGMSKQEYGLGYKAIGMHRAIIGLAHDNPIEVDHQNGDGLDNRGSNLRLATRAQNRRNKVKNRNNSRIYKGVCWVKHCKRWGVRVECSGKRHNAGYFSEDKLEEAARAYDRLALKLFGEFARLNFPRSDYE